MTATEIFSVLRAATPPPTPTTAWAGSRWKRIPAAANGKEESFTYAALDRKTSEKSRKEVTTYYVYDARGNLVRVYDSTGRQLIYGQTVNPYTGMTTIGKSDPYAHLPLK